MRPDGDADDLEKLFKALRDLSPAVDVDERDKLHRILDTNIAGGEERWLALQELLDQLAEKHRIADSAGLAQAVRTAMLVYRGRDALDAKDRTALLTAIAKITDVLDREGNDQRIADIMMNKDCGWVEGEPWSYDKTVGIMMRLGQIKADLLQLALVLKRPRKRGANIKIHRMVEVLEGYWDGLGRNVTRDFHWDPKLKYSVAETDSMRFVQDVLWFIDPAVAKKLRSATRHRLTRRLAKSPP